MIRDRSAAADLGRISHRDDERGGLLRGLLLNSGIVPVSKGQVVRLRGENEDSGKSTIPIYICFNMICIAT